MGHFIVSARKYRPETFKSVVGQDAITSTLKNAIKNSHLGHAYLFCGPRGIGKTTCARIFAKTINCYNLTSDTEPCNQCESCLSFNESRSYNIHELDAASNNSVEDIRTLIEQVRIPPQIGKYSVYIIDEVHMLSLQAFNAFLKTLEEPPAHAVFILATTEKHKIIPTILSRCQIFDFNRIKAEDTVNYLKYIAGKEGINYETEALHVIAQKSDGAMRDALSIFDQVISFSGDDIKYQDVINNLNILDYDYYFKITGYFLQADVSQSLLIFDEILNDGFDAHNFINGLASHFRDLLVSTNPATIKLLETSESIREKYLKQSTLCQPDFLFSALKICNEVDLNIKASRNQRLLVELALVRLSNLTEEKKKSESFNTTEELGQKVTAETTRNSSPTVQRPHVNLPPQSAGPAVNISEKKNVVASSSFSIKDIVADSSDGKKEESLEPVEEGEPIEAESLNEENIFFQEELNEKWIMFAEKLQVERPRISIVLKGHQPFLSDGYSIELLLDNTAQLDEFNKNVKNELTSFLKQELKNSFLNISARLDVQENGKKMIYTTEERFQYLSKKNPALNRLKQQFNLDFE